MQVGHPMGSPQMCDRFGKQLSRLELDMQQVARP
jgi:hypothetical protein